MQLRTAIRMVVLSLILGLVGGCTQTPQTSKSPPKSAPVPQVVATSTILCDIVKEIAAQTINLTCLLKPGTDAHVYEPVPADRLAIEQAQLIFYSGYHFEPALIQLIESTSNIAPKIAVAEKAVPNPQQFEQEGQTQADPHVWQNAQHGIQMVEVIQDNLSELAPQNQDLYAQNAKMLTAQLSAIDSWIKSQIATIPSATRQLVTTHDALGYYATAYSIPVEGALQGISTQEKPTAARVKALVDVIAQAQVPTIFAEVAVNPKLIQAVAKDAKVKVSERELFSDSLGEPGSEGETYPKMLIANTQTIVEGLGGKFTPFSTQFPVNKKK